MTCHHDGYPCERVQVPEYAVWDAHLDPPQLTTALRIGCRCPCAGCAAMVAARHAVDGVPGYPPGVVWNPALDDGERAAYLALPRKEATDA